MPRFDVIAVIVFDVLLNFIHKFIGIGEYSRKTALYQAFDDQGFGKWSRFECEGRCDGVNVRLFIETLEIDTDFDRTHFLHQHINDNVLFLFRLFFA